MQSTDWPAKHCAALREYRALGMSFSQIAKAINAKFKTAYSRSAAIGRAKRMGLTGPGRRKDGLKHWLERPAKAKRGGCSGHVSAMFRRTSRRRRSPNARKWQHSAVSRSSRAISGSLISKLSIAATPMAATRTAKPLPSAGTRAGQVQAIARRIFI
jgi:hypothetical protein